MNEEFKVDTSFNQDQLEKTVNTTTKKDKGKKLQKQLLQKETCMKKKDTVCTHKDIEKNPHAVASNNSKQDARTRLNEVRATSENTSDIQLDLLDYINECPTEQQQILSTEKTNKNNNNTNNVVMIHQTNAALNRRFSNNSANHNKNRKNGVSKLVNNNNNDNPLLLIKNTHQPPTLTQTRTTRKNKLHKTRIQDSTDDHSSVENKTKLHSYQFSSTDIESNNSYKSQLLQGTNILPMKNIYNESIDGTQYNPFSNTSSNVHIDNNLDCSINNHFGKQEKTT